MSRKTERAAAIAVAATLLTTLAAAEFSGAIAQEQILEPQSKNAAGETAADGGDTTSIPKFIAEPVVQSLPDAEADDVSGEADDADYQAASLVELVESMPDSLALSDDMRCLAGAIYFEARGEPLGGQLAVGRVIVNRAESNRFPDTYCGVVFQRSQFSFVRGGAMPTINTSSKAWSRAKAVARIAHEGLWDSPARGALFFHATYVKPRWRLQHVATVSRHVFYR